MASQFQEGFPGVLGYLQRGLFGGSDYDTRVSSAQNSAADRALKAHLENLRLKNYIDQQNNLAKLQEAAAIAEQQRRVAEPTMVTGETLRSLVANAANPNFNQTAAGLAAAKNRAESLTEANRSTLESELAPSQGIFAQQVAANRLAAGRNLTGKLGLESSGNAISQRMADIDLGNLNNPLNQSMLQQNRLAGSLFNLPVHEGASVFTPGVGVRTGPYKKLNPLTGEVSIQPPVSILEPNQDILARLAAARATAARPPVNQAKAANLQSQLSTLRGTPEENIFSQIDKMFPFYNKRKATREAALDFLKSVYINPSTNP